jgi:two-component system, OmpR family, sensor histidine kinase VicK
MEKSTGSLTEEVIDLRKKQHEFSLLEQSLRKEVKVLRDFIENASVALHWVNGSGIIIWVNQAELDLLGYEKEEFLNQHISKFHADKEVVEDILSRLINKETLINYPARLLCKDGTIKDVLINSNVYWEDGKFVHTRCFTRDITGLKANDRAKDAQITELQQRLDQLERENSLLKKEAG